MQSSRSILFFFLLLSVSHFLSLEISAKGASQQDFCGNPLVVDGAGVAEEHESCERAYSDHSLDIPDPFVRGIFSVETPMQQLVI